MVQVINMALSNPSPVVAGDDAIWWRQSESPINFFTVHENAGSNTESPASLSTERQHSGT